MNRQRHMLMAAFFAGMLGAAGAGIGDVPEKYDVILEKNAFRELELPAEPGPAEQPPAAPEPAAPAVSADYELRALIEENGQVRVGLIDKKTGKSFSLSPGEIYEGVSLVSADYREESAVLKYGTETHRVSMRRLEGSAEGGATAQAPAAAPPPFTLPGAVSSIPKPPSVAGGFRGMNIERFLKENPELAKRAPPSMRFPDKNFRPMGKGMTIDQFMKEHPEALKQFPSPLQPSVPMPMPSPAPGGQADEEAARSSSGEGEAVLMPPELPLVPDLPLE